MGLFWHQPKLLNFANTIQAAQYGVEADLIRFSVGLEGVQELVAKFQKALKALDYRIG